MNSLLVGSAVINLIVLVIVFLLWRRGGANAGEGSSQVAQRLESLDQGLSNKFTDLSVRLEKTIGELHPEITKQLYDGLSDVRSAVESQLTKGREEQTGSLSTAITNLEGKFDLLTLRQSQNAQESRAELTKSLETIRGEVDKKLNDITGQVQQKLDQNIKEGFAHFEKVQEHLKSAEEQLRNVGTLGNSIHDLNNLLKLPHLRGKFGEASLERLLADFLPANMFTLQAVSMVHKWYQVQKGLAKSIEDLGKAQKNFGAFESKFEVIGKSLERAQDAYSTATTHLNRYKSRVVKLSGEEVPELTNGESEAEPDNKDMAAKAGSY